MVLGKMKETAEAFLGKKVTHAVVTVPACEVSIQHIGRISLLTPL
jgi:molecular chaperone DnaK (HSP70)